MNKAELVERAAAAAGVNKKAAQAVLDSVLVDIAQVTAECGEVRLKGFGAFKGVKQAARLCRNPGTGESVQVPERVVTKFKPAKKAGEESECPNHQ